MEIVVTMTAEEFEQFRAYQKDAKVYLRKADELTCKLNLIIKKLDYAIEPDSKEEGIYKIVDQTQMDDLWIMLGKCGDELL